VRFTCAVVRVRGREIRSVAGLQEMHWWYEREPQAGSGQPEASAARSRPSLQLLPSSSSTAGGGSLGGGGRRLHGGARPRRAGEEGAAGGGSEPACGMAGGTVLGREAPMREGQRGCCQAAPRESRGRGRRACPALLATAGASAGSRAVAAPRTRERGGGDGDEPGRMPPPRTYFAAGVGEAVADAGAAQRSADPVPLGAGEGWRGGRRGGHRTSSSPADPARRE